MKTITRVLSITLLTMFLLFAAAGCSKSEDDKLSVEGSWVTGVKDEGINHDEKTFYENYLKNFETKLEFKSDGTADISGKVNGTEVSGSGTWKLDDTTLTLSDPVGGINGTAGQFIFKYKDGVFLAEQPEYLCLKRA